MARTTTPAAKNPKPTKIEYPSVVISNSVVSIVMLFLIVIGKQTPLFYEACIW